jgi:hypothetical protein
MQSPRLQIRIQLGSLGYSSNACNPFEKSRRSLGVDPPAEQPWKLADVDRATLGLTQRRAARGRGHFGLVRHSNGRRAAPSGRAVQAEDMQGLVCSIVHVGHSDVGRFC